MASKTTTSRPHRNPNGGGSSSNGALTQRLKVVIRRLPPDLPEAIFFKSIEPFCDINDSKNVRWCQFRAGKIRKSGQRVREQDKLSTYSRAYIAFTDPESLVKFHQGYDGHSFRDKLGNVTQAVVEFAPYQRIPAASAKQDSRQGTIDTDADFLAFQASLTAVPQASTSTAEQPSASVSKPSTMTPLLEHLKAQKAAALAGKAAANASKASKAAASPAGTGSGGEPVKGKKKAKNSASSGKKGAASQSGTATPTGTGPGLGDATSATATIIAGGEGKKSRKGKEKEKHKDGAAKPVKEGGKATKKAAGPKPAHAVPKLSAGNFPSLSSSNTSTQTQATQMDTNSSNHEVSLPPPIPAPTRAQLQPQILARPPRPPQASRPHGDQAGQSTGEEKDAQKRQAAAAMRAAIMGDAPPKGSNARGGARGRGEGRGGIGRGRGSGGRGGSASGRGRGFAGGSPAVAPS